MVKDVVLSVTSWLLDLFGFGKEAQAVANAKNFSLGDMVFNAIESIWEWFKGLLDIDVTSIAKSIPGMSTLLGWMGIGSEKETKKQTELDKAEVPKVDSASITMPDFSKVLEGIDWTQFDFGSIGFVDLNFGQKLKSMVGTIMGLEKGGIVGMSPFAKGSLGKAFGLESGGLFTLSQGEMVLDNQAAQTFLGAAELLTGMELSQMELEKVNNQGAGVVIVDSSTKQFNNNNQGLMLPAQPARPESPARLE